LFFSKIFVFFRVGGPREHKVSGGWAQGSQAGAAKCTIESGAQVGYSGIVRRRNAETQVQVQGTGLTLYQGTTTSGCKNRKDKRWQKKN